MKMTYRVTGAEDLQRVLGELPNAVRNRVAMNALRAGGRVLEREMRVQVPVLTGELKKAIATRVYTSRKAGQRAVAIGVRGKEAPLAHLVEFGTDPHPIAAKPGKTLRYVKDGEVRYATKVRHPGAKAQSFVRKATDTKGSEASARVVENAAAGIIREAERLGQKGRSRR